MAVTEKYPCLPSDNNLVTLSSTSWCRMNSTSLLSSVLVLAAVQIRPVVLILFCLPSYSSCFPLHIALHILFSLTVLVCVPIRLTWPFSATSMMGSFLKEVQTIPFHCLVFHSSQISCFQPIPVEVLKQ